MRQPLDSGGRSLLDQLASAYLSARWYMGGGLILLMIGVMAAGLAGANAWAVIAAGAIILAHAFAMTVWGMEEPLVALLIDVTVASLAAMLVSTSNNDQMPIVLTFVGASILIGLFTERWVRAAILAYVAAFTLTTLLMIAGWDLTAAMADFIGGAFVVGLVIGVITSIRARMVELEAARAQTIGVVSHELRNHLTGVISAIELINEDETQLDPDETTELLDLAYQQSVEAGEVIEDLLIASRAERGVLDAISEPVDLCPITETAIRRTSLETGEILHDFSGGPVWALADPLRYKQIVRNLLTNALRYGGDTIRVSIETIDDTVSMVVADNGEGIDEADLSSLFLPYRSGAASSGVPGSSGLGLWIARGLAHKMDGEIRYRREGGQTVFELTLPAADPTVDEDATETLDEREPMGSATR